MGYRSEVGCIIEFDTEENMKNYLGYVEATYGEDLGEFLEIIKAMSSKDRIRFNHDWLKWYSDYKQVIAFENMLAESEEAEGIVCSKFVRIGENDDDIEEKTFSKDGDTCIDYQDLGYVRKLIMEGVD
jgi:hypothetical protein